MDRGSSLAVCVDTAEVGTGGVGTGGVWVPGTFFTLMECAMVSRPDSSSQPTNESVSEASSQEWNDTSASPESSDEAPDSSSTAKQPQAPSLVSPNENIDPETIRGVPPELSRGPSYGAPRGVPYGAAYGASPEPPYGMPPTGPYPNQYPNPNGQYNGVPPMYPYPYPYSYPYPYPPYGVPYDASYGVPNGSPYGYSPQPTEYQEGPFPNAPGEGVATAPRPNGGMRAGNGGEWHTENGPRRHRDEAVRVTPVANRGEWRTPVAHMLPPPVFPPYGPPPKHATLPAGQSPTELHGTTSVAVSRPGRSKVGRPVNEQRRAERREQILSAAIRMFAERGFAESRMQDLADQLGVAKGTIFHYFPTKEDLFLQTCRYYCFDRMFAYLESIGFLQATNPVQSIYTTIRAFIEYFRANPETVELQILERAYFREGVPELYQEARNQFRREWLAGIQRMLGSGWFREDVSAERLFEMINYLIYGMMFQNQRETMVATPHEQAAAITRIFTAGVLHADHAEQIDEYIRSAESEIPNDRFPDSFRP